MGEQAKKSFIINVLFIGLWLGIIMLAGKFLLKYLFPFVLAVLVAMLMQKPAKLLSKKIRLKKGTCAALLSAILYVLVAAVSILAVARLFSITGRAISSVSDTRVRSVVESAEGYFDSLADRFYGQSETVVATEKIIVGILESLGQKLAAFLSETATNIIKLTPSFLFSTVVALAATCYIAKDFDTLVRFIKELIGVKAYRKTVKIKCILKGCIFKMLAGYLLIMLVTFGELSIGFVAIGIKNPLLMALLVAAVDILPVLGAGAVLLPWSVINLFLGNTLLGVGLIAIYVTVTVIRNFLEPKIVSKKTGINPLFILFAMVLGLRLFGAAGLIIFPVTFIVTVKYYKNEMELNPS